MLKRMDWVYAVVIENDVPTTRHGPFESIDDAIAWIEHEELEGNFDFVTNTNFYKA